MINDNDAHQDVTQPLGRQELVWKGALVLLCLGFFALVVWAGGNDDRSTERCAYETAFTRTTCPNATEAQVSSLPAKGGLAPALAAHRPTK
jgi:hypothetical protein